MIFLLPRRLMRHVGSGIGVDSIAVLDRGHHGPMRGIITSQFIGDHPAGLTALTFAETATEAPRRLLVASPLRQDINRVAVLVDRSPQILLFALEGHKHFIKMPRITKSTLSLLQYPRVRRSTLPAPWAKGCVGDGEASFRQSLFDCTEPEAEAMREPDGMTANFGRKTVSWIAELVGIHATAFGKSELH